MQTNVLCHGRSTSRATPCLAPTWRRPPRGLPGRPSTSLTTAATMSNAFATLAKPASQIPACWKWAGRGSRCATAPATDPPAAPLTVSAEWKRQMVSFQLSQPLDVSLLSHSNWLSAYLRASYWPPRLKPFLLSVCLLFIRSLFLASSNFSPLCVLQNLNVAILISSPCLRPPPRLYQRIKASGALMNFQSTKPISSLQLILAFPALSFIHKHTQMQMLKLKLESCKEAQTRSLYPSSPLHHAVSVSHTPGELDAVNVCTNRLLIDKLFMLSSGSIHIRGETGAVAPHHSKEASNTDAAVKVCLWRCSLPQREKQIFFGGFGVSARLNCGGLPSLWVVRRCTTHMPHAVVIIRVSPNVHYQWGFLSFSLSLRPHFWLSISVAGTSCSLHTLKPTLKFSWRALNKRWQAQRKPDYRLEALRGVTATHPRH